MFLVSDKLLRNLVSGSHQLFLNIVRIDKCDSPHTLGEGAINPAGNHKLLRLRVQPQHHAHDLTHVGVAVVAALAGDNDIGIGNLIL